MPNNMPRGKSLSVAEKDKISFLHEKGKSNRQIAKEIGRSPKVVDSYVKSPADYGKRSGRKHKTEKILKMPQERNLERNCCACDEKPGNIKILSSSLLTKMFQDVTGLEVKNDYCLCESCQHDLKKCYNFKKQCLEISSLYEDSSQPIEKVFVQSLNNLVNEERDESEATPSNDVSVVDQVYDEQSVDLSILDDEQSVDLSTLDDEHIDNAEEEWSGNTRNNRFPCSDCSKSFSKNSAYLTHQLSHLNHRNFVCHRSQCTSAFNVISRLVRHLRTVHKATEEEIRSFRETNRKAPPIKIKAASVSRRGTDETRVQCKVCMKVLANVNYLKEHMMLQHLNNAPYKCEYETCCKKFANWSLLQQHQKKHEGIYDFRCEYCGKGFVQRKTLNQHLKHSHQLSKEKIDAIQKANSTCDECEKTFKTCQQLTEHKALEHGKGDKLICDICAKVFLSRVKLISHQKYHRAEKKIRCTNCPSTFTEERGLKTHLRRVHNLKDTEIYDLFMKL